MGDSFQQTQHKFTQYLRDPDNQPMPPDIESRRMAIYRDLIYNNIESFASSGFPVLRKIVEDEKWHQLIRGFLVTYRAHTPLFSKLSQEILQYLENITPEQYGLPPFYFELAYYEWLEASLALDAREAKADNMSIEGDLLSQTPVLNPLIVGSTFIWPVHKISPDYMPETPPEQPTHLLVYRDRNHEVGFLELNIVSAYLVEQLKTQEDKTGQQILDEIADKLEYDKTIVLNSGRQLLDDFHKRDIILGVKA